MDNDQYTYHDYSQPDPPHQPLYLELMMEFLRGDPAIKTVLDAGCGDGNFTASLASDAGVSMYGIDLSQGGIQRARKNWPHISFAEASLTHDLRDPFPGIVAFDAIVSVEVIEHLYSPRTFIRRAKDALRPGGILILTTPYWGYFKNLVLAITNRTDRYFTALWEGGHIKHWSYKSLRALGEENGLKFVAFRGAGRPIPFLWNGMMMVFEKPSHCEPPSEHYCNRPATPSYG